MFEVGTVIAILLGITAVGEAFKRIAASTKTDRDDKIYQRYFRPVLKAVGELLAFIGPGNSKSKE